MGLETGTYIDDLIVTNPTTTDKRRQGDDHFRLIKRVLKNSFPNINAPVVPSPAELNYLVGLTGTVQAQLDAKLSSSGAAGAGLVGASGVLAVGAGAGIAVNADDVAIALSGLSSIEASGLATTDGYLVDDGGVPKRLQYSDAGLIEVTDTTTARTLTTADINTYITFNNSSAITVTLNTGLGKKGNVIIIEQGGSGQVTVDGTATVNAANGKRTANTYSVIALVCKSAGSTWTLMGDATT